MTVLTMPETASPIIAPRRDEPLYEVVDGRRVELPSMSIYAVRIASKLQAALETYAAGKRLGMVVTEGLFILDAKRDVRRRPDVAFVSVDRWPLDRPLPETGDWEVIPSLAIEVISPNDLFEEVLAKMAEYFRLDVQQVWLVSPAEQEVYVYNSPTRVQILTAAEELDGGSLVPGFRIPVGSLFQQATKS
jgi:Uma2 family endonuclease